MEAAPGSKLRLVSTRERPDLAPVVADWLWNAFGRQDGRSLADSMAQAIEATTSVAMPLTFVLLDGDAPIGTASLTAEDLEERPDLTPWLAGVFVVPEARGQGHAARLVAAVEDEARRAGVAVLWLYTSRAERVYARIGWRTVELLDHGGRPVALMRRDLAQ